MKQMIDELTERIEKLYHTYENFIWRGGNKQLIITFQKNRGLSFFLYKDDNVVDELYLTFDEAEYDLYKATCLRTFIICFGNVLVHKHETENIYYNDKHKPYLHIISNDDNVTALIDSMLAKQEQEIINNDKNEVKSITERIKKRIYDKKFLETLDNRIKISHEMLKWR